MSKPVSALDGKVAAGAVTVKELGLQGMIALRGTFADAAFAEAVKAASGCDIPASLGLSASGDNEVLWMSPDELLWLLPHGSAPSAAKALDAALAGQHAMVSEVSDARAIFSVEGPFAAEVLAKLMPLDMSLSHFAVGTVRRSKMVQVAAAVWRDSETSFRVICFRSTADYVFGLLQNAAAGGAVGVLGR